MDILLRRAPDARTRTPAELAALEFFHCQSAPELASLSTQILGLGSSSRYRDGELLLHTFELVDPKVLCRRSARSSTTR